MHTAINISENIYEADYKSDVISRIYYIVLYYPNLQYFPNWVSRSAFSEGQGNEATPGTINILHNLIMPKVHLRHSLNQHTPTQSFNILRKISRPLLTA